MFYTLIKQVFDQSERAQDPIYILMENKTRFFYVLLHK